MEPLTVAAATLTTTGNMGRSPPRGIETASARLQQPGPGTMRQAVGSGDAAAA